ncbi:MAG TPA: ion transporter, partial [Planctomycetaceae bacterium]
MQRLRRLVDSPAFTGVIVAVILANALVLGLHTYPGIDRKYGDTLILLNALCLAVFVVEISLRVAAYLPRPWEFFREG